MSISIETVNQHKDDPAVVCCLTKEGTEISPSDLEDPSIFGDLEDSGLLELPDNVLKIGQIIGAKLKQTIDALTPLTPDLVDGYKESKTAVEHGKNEIAPEISEPLSADKNETGDSACAGRVDISIGEGKNIKFSIFFGTDESEFM